MSIRILLIEDNPDHILLTKRILKEASQDYQVDSMSEVKEGLRKIIEEEYDLVLCDYRLSGFTAFDVLKEMRNKSKDLPFIVVTASGNEKVAVDLLKEGACDYIVKDVSYEDTLPMVIKRSIERYNAKKEKERLEEKIKQVAEEWETTFNSITDLISIHDKNFKIVRVNKAFTNVFGMNSEEIIDKACYEVFHGTNGPWQNCLHRQAMETKKPVWVEFFEPRLGIYFEISVSPIFNEKSEVIATVHIAKDITERKKAQEALEDAYRQLKETQEQLIQSAKMVAMGQLAAGISHELNQPLTGIKGFAQAALIDLVDNNPLRKDLNKIIEQADRMDRIIKNVRFFARKSDFKMEEIDVNKPIEDSLMLLAEQLRLHNIRLNKLLSPDLPKIKGDSNQLQQAFLNLISNARDAIDSLKSPDGGELLVKSSLSQDNSSVEIIFKDTGCGIPEEDLSNLFNPFFTTKGPDRGTGLGLAICYRIIDNHQGRIDVESEEGKGATFKIILPVEQKVA